MEFSNGLNENLLIETTSLLTMSPKHSVLFLLKANFDKCSKDSQAHW